MENHPVVDDCPMMFCRQMLKAKMIKNVQFCPTKFPEGQDYGVIWYVCVFPIFFPLNVGRKSLGDGSCNWLRVRRNNGANGSTPLRHFPRELRSDLASNQ